MNEENLDGSEGAGDGTESEANTSSDANADNGTAANPTGEEGGTDAGVVKDSEGNTVTAADVQVGDTFTDEAGNEFNCTGKNDDGTPICEPVVKETGSSENTEDTPEESTGADSDVSGSEAGSSDDAPDGEAPTIDKKPGDSWEVQEGAEKFLHTCTGIDDNGDLLIDVELISDDNETPAVAPEEPDDGVEAARCEAKQIMNDALEEIKELGCGVWIIIPEHLRHPSIVQNHIDLLADEADVRVK